MKCFQQASLFRFWFLRALFTFLICVCAQLPAQAEKNSTCDSKRIIALTPSLAEWVSEILGEEEARTRIVGRVDFSSYPTWLQSFPLVGKYTQINTEKVLSLKPTCVLAQEKMNLTNQVQKIKDLGVSVLWIKSESLFKVDSMIRELSLAMGVKERGEQLANRWNKKVEALKRMNGKKANAFIQIQGTPLVSAGGDSTVSELLELAGFQNVLKTEKGYPVVSKENVVAHNPEYLLIVSMEKTKEGKEQELQRARQYWSKFSNLNISNPDRIVLLESDHFARCSFRSLFAVEDLLNSRVGN